jgi:DNA gyrase inhibitor GyrI
MNKKFSVVIIDSIPVWCVHTKGICGVEEAIKNLESKVMSLKGRKCYGVLTGSPEDGIYRACTSIKNEDNFKSIEKWIIPGGKYVRVKIEGWEKDPTVIGIIFSDMAKISEVDNTRPSIEFYRSQKELILFLPTKG